MNTETLTTTGMILEGDAGNIARASRKQKLDHVLGNLYGMLQGLDSELTVGELKSVLRADIENVIQWVVELRGESDG